MGKQIKIVNKTIGDGYQVFIIAEIGLNHNGDIDVAKKLIDVAVKAGCDAVKFQKRDPELCVPKDQRDKMRETPWGYISYMEYRYKVEFSRKQYDIINQYCRTKGILWTASCWDKNSLKFINEYHPPFHKIPSASITNIKLLEKYAISGFPIIMSTGMSTPKEIDDAVKILKNNEAEYAILHCTSTYPCPLDQINLNHITVMKDKYKVPIGYSGHETGLAPTLGAVALGACIVERHITLDRSMWGSDQAASIEPMGLSSLVSNIRDISKSLGDGQKKVYDSEMPIREKLRNF